MNKNKIYYLLLGIGLGVIITSSMNIAFNKTEKTEYSEEEIKEKARELGMISMKDNIEKNEKEEKKEIEEAKANEAKEKAKKEKEKLEKEKTEAETDEAMTEQQEQSESVIVSVTAEDTASSIITKLQDEGVIENAGEFKSIVVQYNLQREFIAGEYEINKGSSYEEVLRRMIRDEKLKNSGFLEN